MNTALVDHYCCPADFIEFELTNSLSDEEGYFRFGQNTICYGRSASGYRARNADSTLYDAMEDVASAGSAVALPFNPNDLINNLRFERYAHHHSLGSMSRWKRLLKNGYYSLRPLMPVALRRHIQRANLNGWPKLCFPHWPVDTTVEEFCEQLLILSMKAKGVDRIPFMWDPLESTCRHASLSIL